MDVQALLRFMTTSAKLPLATAMGKMKELRAADINKYAMHTNPVSPN